jgi:hypothetical protein
MVLFTLTRIFLNTEFSSHKRAISTNKEVGNEALNMLEMVSFYSCIILNSVSGFPGSAKSLESDP